MGEVVPFPHRPAEMGKTGEVTCAWCPAGLQPDDPAGWRKHFIECHDFHGYAVTQANISGLVNDGAPQ